MRTAAEWMSIGLTLALLGTACSSQQSLPPPSAAGGATGAGGLRMEGSGGLHMEGSGGSRIEGTGGMGMGGIPSEHVAGMTGSMDKDGGPGPDAVMCCPPDPGPITVGSARLGGAAVNGMCNLAFDFQCTGNWRIETDPQGCPIWRYDYGASFCPDALGVHVDAVGGSADGGDHGG